MEISSSRERVKALMEQGKTDRIPKGELCINDEVVCQAMGCVEAGFEERYGLIQQLGLDLVSLSPEYPRNLKELPKPSQYTWPDVNKWVSDTELFTFAVLDGAFEWGMRILGLHSFCVLLKSPLSIKELVDSVEKLNLGMVERLADAGTDGFILADDIAYNDGLFANPQVLRDSFIPSLARQVDEIRCGGLPVFYHSDGNYRLVQDDIVNAGFTGLQCLEKNAGMDLVELWAQYGEKLCLWGHLDVDDIEAAVDSVNMTQLTASVRALSQQGRFILGTTSGLFKGMDIPLLQSIYKTF
jgi:uroporphyrinogen decarboxylase